jgi:hypothetical protein
LDRLKNTINARMEEMSFRSGAAVFAGVPIAAGVAITLAVALGGHSAAATSPPRPAAVARSTPPPSRLLPAASPSAPTRATPAASLMPAKGYQPPVPVTAATTTPQVAASSAVGPATRRFPRLTPQTLIGQPLVPDPGGLSWLSRLGASEWRRDGLLDRDGGGLPAGRPARLRP